MKEAKLWSGVVLRMNEHFKGANLYDIRLYNTLFDDE